MSKKKVLYIFIIAINLVNFFIYYVLDIKIPYLFYLLFIPFNLICILFYRHSKLITFFHVLTIVNLFGYFMIPLFPQFFRLFGLISFIGVIATALVAFGTILQNRTYKFIERSFMWFSVYNIIFFSLYTPLILNLFIGFFGPFPIAVQRTINTFYAVQMIIYLANTLLQLRVIYLSEMIIFFEKEEKSRTLITTNKVQDLPFFKK